MIAERGVEADAALEQRREWAFELGVEVGRIGLWADDVVASHEHHIERKSGAGRRHLGGHLVGV
jgi:hypothetical protein